MSTEPAIRDEKGRYTQWALKNLASWGVQPHPSEMPSPPVTPPQPLNPAYNMMGILGSQNMTKAQQEAYNEQRRLADQWLRSR